MRCMPAATLLLVSSFGMLFLFGRLTEGGRVVCSVFSHYSRGPLSRRSSTVPSHISRVLNSISGLGGEVEVEVEVEVEIWF